MHKHIRSLVLILAAGLLALAITGCTRESRKAKYVEQADRHFAEGKYDEAEIDYKNAIQLGGANPRAISQLATIYTEQGRMARAVGYITKGAELAPEDLDLKVKLAQLKIANGNLKEAQDLAGFVLDHRPTDPEAPMLLATAVANPKEAELLRTRLQGLPPPAKTGPSVLTALGMIEFRLHHIKEAEALFNQAVAADPKFAGAYAALGLLHLTEKDPAATDQALKMAAEVSPPRSAHRLQYAKYKIQTGDLSAGKKLLEEINQKTPDYLPAWVALAEIVAGEKKYPESAALIEKVLVRDPDNLDALLIRGRLKLATNENAAAVAEFERLATAYPRMAQIQFDLGRAYSAAGDMNKAIDSLNQAVTLAPNYVEAIIPLATMSIRKGDLATAVMLLRKLTQQRPELILARLLLADAYRGQGNLDDALAIYQQVEAQAPKNAQVPMLRGQVLMQQKKFAEARAAFLRAEQLSPEVPAPAEQLVNLDLAEKNYAAARQRVEEFIAKNPKQGGPYQLLAKIFLAQRDMDQAEAALKKAIELQPDGQSAYFTLAGIYSTSNQQAKALASLDQALARNPKDTTTLMLISVIQDQQKNYTAARDGYEKLLAVNPQFAVALNNLAYLYSERLGDLDKGLEFAQRAREQMPSNPNIADTLGWIRYKKRLYPAALTLLQEAADNLPDSEEIRFHLGMTHYMLGNEELAHLALKQALQSGNPFNGIQDAKKSLAILDIDPASSDPATRAALEKAIAERKDDIVALTRLAGIYEREGHQDKAIAALESALEVNPKNAALIISLAKIYENKKDVSKALDLAKNARKVAPEDPSVARTLGRLAYATGDYTWAASLLQEAARKLPNSSDVLFEFAQAAYSVGRVADAGTALNGALNGPESGKFLQADEAKRFLDLIGLAANPTDAVAQSARVTQILQTDPNYVPALMVSGVISEQQHNASAATKTYEKILSRFSDFVPAKLRLAILGAAQAEFDQKTYDRAQQARTAYPSDPELAKALGILTLRKGDAARAVTLLKESSVSRAGDAEVWYYLGLAQVQAKDLTGAKKSLQKSLEVGLKPELASDARKVLGGLK